MATNTLIAQVESDLAGIDALAGGLLIGEHPGTTERLKSDLADLYAGMGIDMDALVQAERAHADSAISSAAA